MTNSQPNDDRLHRLHRLRQIACDVLDKHCRNFPLLCRSQRAAIEALLGVYACALRDLRAGRLPAKSNHAKAEVANDGLRGMAHCLRWIVKYCPSRLLVLKPPSQTLFNEAHALLEWGVLYDPLWNKHSACERGLIDVQIDEPAKTITFLPERDVDPQFFCTQSEAKKADDERKAQARPEKRLEQLSSAWFNSIRPGGGGLRFDDSAIRRSGALDVAVEWMDETCLPELPSQNTLAGCTVGDLRRVLAALYVYSLYVTRLEDCGEDQPSHGVKFDSRVVVHPRAEMVNWLAELSGVVQHSVEAIVSTLTFDPKDEHVTLAQQPFVSSSDGTLFLLPRMFLLLPLSMMYVGALNRTKIGQKVYSQAINQIEDNGVRGLADDLRLYYSNSFQLAERRQFALQEASPIEPDIVLFSAGDREVLVIDVKYATPPFGPANVHRDIEEMGKWTTRMSEYVNTFRTNRVILGQHFNAVSQTDELAIFGLILVRWPFPVPVEFPPAIHAVDWPSLKNHLEQCGAIRASELVKWTRCRPDVQIPPDLVWKCREVEVGGWTYKYSVPAPPT